MESKMLKEEIDEIFKIIAQKKTSITNKLFQYVFEHFTLRDLDHLLNKSSLSSNNFLLFKNGSMIPNELILSTDKIHLDKDKISHYINNEDYSLKIAGVDKYNDFLADFKSTLAKKTNHRISINLYLTPSTSPCFIEHQGPYNIFILQIEGEKKWHINCDSTSIPLSIDQPSSLIDNGQSFDLKKNEVLHLPPSALHKAENIKNYPSLHLTIGIHPLTFEELLNNILESRRTLIFSKQNLPYELEKIDVARTKDLFLKVFNSYFTEASFQDQIEEIILNQNNTSAATHSNFNLNQTLRKKTISQDDIFEFNQNLKHDIDFSKKDYVVIKLYREKYLININSVKFSKMLKLNHFSLLDFQPSDYETLNKLFIKSLIILKDE